MMIEISVTRKLIDTMKLFYFLPFVSAVFAAVLSTTEAGNINTIIDVKLVKPCNIDDMACLKESTELFLNRTYQGIPAFDIVAIDPLAIPAVDVKVDGGDVVYENRNIIVKGLRYQKLFDYKMDLKAKSVKLTTVADLEIDSDVTGVFKSGKRIPGHSHSHGRALGTASYNFELKKDDKGIEYFVVGPETIACQHVTPPNVHYNAELERALSSDADAAAHSSHSHADETFCAIVKTAYASVVHNIRAAAKVLPASTFFNNIHGNK